MTSNPLVRTILAAGVLIATTGFARAEIPLCPDYTGAVAQAEGTCQIRFSHPLGASPAKPPVKSRLAARIKKYAAAEKARTANSAGKRAVGRSSVIDAATMNTAKVSSVANDHASAAIREQLLAERMDRDAKSWSFWRL